jgi:hypothetical protein
MFSDRATYPSARERQLVMLRKIYQGEILGWRAETVWGLTLVALRNQGLVTLTTDGQGKWREYRATLTAEGEVQARMLTM